MDSRPCPHQGHALRRGRYSEPGRIYLLTTITHSRQPIFNDWRHARLLITEMRRLHDAMLVESLAWVVMPDHLHWLIQLGPVTLASLMQQLKSRSAIAIRMANPTLSARFWQKGFHDHALRKEEDLRATARYIVASPLRAGLTGRLGDYPHWDAKWL